MTESWLREYNDERPHDSLGRVPPDVHAEANARPEV